MIKILLIIISTALLFISCSNNSEIKKDLEMLQSKSITIPTDIKTLVGGKDTVVNSFMESELKLIIYSDSSACSSCAIQKMYLWDSFIEDAEKYQGRLKFYFLFSPTENDLTTVNLALRTNMFDYPVFIDSAGTFAKENPHLPKKPQLHTFLLDKDNKVILVGNPLNNPKIEEMFYKMVEERLGKK